MKRFESSISQKFNFAYEDRFTGKGAWEIPKRFKNEGFEIHLVFCGLNTLIRSVQRVDMRSKNGGFHVTALAIENNYFGNMEMLDKNFSIFNSVKIIDTSVNIIQIATLELGKVVEAIHVAEIPLWLKNGMPEIFNAIEVFNINSL